MMKRIICFGAGSDFNTVIGMLNPTVCDVLAVVDRHVGKVITLPENGLFWSIPSKWGGVTQPIEIVKEIEFDYILICSSLYCDQMIDELYRYCIPNDKIIRALPDDFSFDHKSLYQSSLFKRNTSYNHRVLIELTDCEIFDHVICRELMLRRSRHISQFQFQISEDYVRVSTLELMANRLNTSGLEGAVAEVGVFQGTTSALLNEIFPNRKLYLFDTFDSFNSDVMSRENSAVSNSFVEMFKDTSVELVLSKMKYPENIVIRKGVFPDTIEGLPSIDWAFVSLDVDLYQSTLAGLKYFYPRLIKNGYIVIHDCLHHQSRVGGNVTGAGKAVDDFCNQHNLQYVPLTDTYGSVVLTK